MYKSEEAANRACNSVVGYVDEGSLNSVGQILLMDTDSVLIASLSFSDPAYLNAVDGTALSNLIFDGTAIRDATAALFDVVNRDSSNVWSGTISTFSGNGDIKLNAVILYRDSTVSISDASYIVPR